MSRPKRIFIAVNPPEKLKKELADLKNRWSRLPCRWVQEKNLHITLAFLGNTGDKELEKIGKAVQETAQQSQPLSIKLDKVCYGPPRRKPPSLIWIEGPAGDELLNLKKELDKKLSAITDYRPAKRRYIPHITLGRIKKMEWRRLSPEERPSLKIKPDYVFRADSVEVMESKLKRTGAQYKILKSFKL